jgi:hypothetical protein
MTLKSLLVAIKSKKIITINLFSNSGLLLISFGLPGYDCLDDYLLDVEVDSLEIITLTNLNVTLKEYTVPNTDPIIPDPDPSDPGNTDPTDPSNP